MTTREHSTINNLQVLYIDNHIIAVNKRSGDIVQGDKTSDTPLSDIVKGYLAKHFNKPGNVFLGVVHRLDRPTSGVIIFARTSKALTRLNKALVDRSFDKTYWAMVSPYPNLPKAQLVHYLKRNTRQNKSYAYLKPVPDSKKAILEYQLLLKLEKYALLEIQLHTGRHHQIRAQLAKIGCCIKGDLKYGAQRSNANGGIHLHARTLHFEHPVQKIPITITAPVPSPDPLWKVVSTQ